MKGRALVLAGAITLLTAGCVTPSVVAPRPVIAESPPEPLAVVVLEPEARPPARPALSDSESLLNYVDHVRKLPAAEFSREVEIVRKLYARVRTDVVRMRYAILLTAPAAPAGEDARAVELLDPLLKSADAALRALATLLNVQLQEQRRAQGLQQKLDALMSLDKTMIERGR